MISPGSAVLLICCLVPCSSPSRGHESRSHIAFLACQQLNFSRACPLCSGQVAYFVNSGSEANDMAIMMARLYTRNYDILALRNAYHGLSDATVGLLGHHTWKPNLPQARHTSWQLAALHRAIVGDLLLLLKCKAYQSIHTLFRHIALAITHRADGISYQ